MCHKAAMTKKNKKNYCEGENITLRDDIRKMHLHA